MGGGGGPVWLLGNKNLGQKFCITVRDGRKPIVVRLGKKKKRRLEGPIYGLSSSLNVRFRDIYKPKFKPKCRV